MAEESVEYEVPEKQFLLYPKQWRYKSNWTTVGWI
jgi:hypothetical protein